MERAVGRGWAWRMEHHDHVMCEDMPKSWLVDRKRPKESSVQRLEQYAARFGYPLPEGSAGRLSDAAAAALASLEVSTPVLENSSEPRSAMSFPPTVSKPR